MHSFQDSLNPTYNCGNDVETTTHYLLHCPLFSDERLIPINNIRSMNNNISNLNISRFSEVLLFCNSFFNNIKIIFNFNKIIKYIVSSKRFEFSLFDSFVIHAWLFYLPLIIIIINLFFFIELFTIIMDFT